MNKKFKLEIGQKYSRCNKFSLVAQLCLTLCDPWTAAHQASLSITSSQSLLKLMSVDDAIQPSHPLWSPSPPAFNLSQHRGLFQWSQLFNTQSSF